MTTSTTWYIALIHTEESAYLPITALALSVQMSTQQKRQVTLQCYYKNSFDLQDTKEVCRSHFKNHYCKLMAISNYINVRN